MCRVRIDYYSLCPSKVGIEKSIRRMSYSYLNCEYPAEIASVSVEKRASVHAALEMNSARRGLVEQR